MNKGNETIIKALLDDLKNKDKDLSFWLESVSKVGLEEKEKILENMFESAEDSESITRDQYEILFKNLYEYSTPLAEEKKVEVYAGRLLKLINKVR